ncbi:hypothetical protein Tco_1534699 [Tanacetum coccineum]
MECLVTRLDMVLELWKFVAMVVVCGGSMVVEWCIDNKYRNMYNLSVIIHLTEEQIKEQKRIEESAKSEVAKHEVEVRKEVLVDLLGPAMVSKYYKA